MYWRLKRTAFILFLIIQTPILANNNYEVDQVDTLQLTDFNEDKVLRYSIHNVFICIPLKAYLEEIREVLKTYKRLVRWDRQTRRLMNVSEMDSEDQQTISRKKVIDSVYMSVKSMSRHIDTVDVSHKIFSAMGLSSLADFDLFIENNNCAVFDESGKRHSYILKETVTYYYGIKPISGGRRYYLLEKKTLFLRGRDWVS